MEYQSLKLNQGRIIGGYVFFQFDIDVFLWI